ncbi:Hydroxyproline dehydrogenase [Bulinus truncatus]|nr:Hydroxyproline dehydrogenase [Bulinus truncatus]
MFGNNNIAYVNRSTWELVRTLAIFYVCRFPTFTDNAVHLMSLSYRVLGKKASEFLIGKTIYSQFVAGRTSTELSRATERLQQEGIGPILCIPTEGYRNRPTCRLLKKPTLLFTEEANPTVAEVANFTA